MTFVAGEACGEKGLDDLVGKFHTDDARPEYKDIHVIVFHTLMRGIGVVANSCTYTRELIRRDGSAYAAAADENSTIDVVASNRIPDRFREIGIVIVLVIRVRAQVKNVVVRCSKRLREVLLQLESGMIGGEAKSHVSPY